MGNHFIANVPNLTIFRKLKYRPALGKHRYQKIEDAIINQIRGVKKPWTHAKKP